MGSECAFGENPVPAGMCVSASRLQPSESGKEGRKEGIGGFGCRGRGFFFLHLVISNTDSFFSHPFITC